MNRYFFLLLCILSVSGVFAVDLKLTGIIPQKLDTGRLIREYSRISKTISPDVDHDPNPITIIFYRVADRRKTGIHLPEWGGGGALGKDTIVIPVDRPSAFFRSDMERIIIHEMVHCALARAWGILHVPRWFHEGMAMSLSGEILFEEQVILSRAIIMRSLVPLDSIEYLNRFGLFRAQIAYSQCHFAVQFLLSVYGYDLIPELLKESRAHRRFDTACLQVFGLTVKELDRLLHREITRRYRFIFILADYSFLWIGILLLAVAAFIATKLRNRKKRLTMEKEENKEIAGETIAQRPE
jgi:hypothetical protein